MEVKVFFYGVIAEIAGTFIRVYNGVGSFGDLQLRLRDDFPGIEHYNYRVVHNRVIAVSDPVLNNGDEIALLPPFYGG